MRLLLDTHVVLWHLGGLRRLGAGAERALLAAETVFVSAVTFAEIGVKAAVGKLTVPPDLVERVVDAGLRMLPLAPEHGLAVANLPPLHRDPFDRLLITQAIAEDLVLVTADVRIPAYAVATSPALD